VRHTIPKNEVDLPVFSEAIEPFALWVSVRHFQCAVLCADEGFEV
jgi:hypothetical protein